MGGSRRAALRCVGERVAVHSARLCASAAMLKWAAVAQEQSALATRYMLHANDLLQRGRRRWMAEAIARWRAETVRAMRATQAICLSRLFACWRFFVQEQVLLRKYLNECAMAGFQ